MPLKFNCPSCDAPLNLANEGLAGKRIKCPKCTQVITVPLPEAAGGEPEMETLEEEIAPVPRPGARKGAMSPPDDDDDPRPRKRRGPPEAVKGGISPMVWIFGGLGLVLLLCGGCVGGCYYLMNQAKTGLEKLGDDIKAAEEKARKERENRDKDWPEEWTMGKTYEIPDGGGLTLKSKLTKDDPRDKLRVDSYSKAFPVRMTAGKMYKIRMNARDPNHNDFKNLDPVLRLENPAGQQVAFNDDAVGEPSERDSRIEYNCPQDGVYTVIATNLRTSTGAFTLTITKSDK